MPEYLRVVEQIEGNSRRFLLVWKEGARVGDGLQRFAAENGITHASLSGIGAVAEVTFGFLDTERAEYHKTTHVEPAEVLSFVGNLVLGTDGQPALHAHITVAGSDGVARGGHFFDAVVHPTLEVVVAELGTGDVRRGDLDPANGARLLQAG